jgi:hypothetical protein
MPLNSNEKRLVALNPNYAMGYLFLAEAQMANGMSGDALPTCERLAAWTPNQRTFTPAISVSPIYSWDAIRKRFRSSKNSLRFIPIICFVMLACVLPTMS